MTARRAPAAHLCLRVGSRHQVAFVPFPARAPMFVIGAAGTLVSFSLPEQIDAGHVDFARQLAAKAWAYAVAVERRYRGLPRYRLAPHVHLAIRGTVSRTELRRVLAATYHQVWWPAASAVRFDGD